MPKYSIRTMEKWNNIADWLNEYEYKPWSYQFSWNMPEGFHVWFQKSGYEDVEVITHSEEVHKAIMKYKSIKAK